MYNTILIPLSLEHGIAETAVRVARSLLAEGGRIIALHVHEAASGSVRAYIDEDTVRKAYESSKHQLAERVAAHSDIEAVTRVGHAARTILDYASEQNVDCIVVGSHKPGLTDYFLGSASSHVVRYAPCNVHILRT